jgi:hypothetical protein
VPGSLVFEITNAKIQVLKKAGYDSALNQYFIKIKSRAYEMGITM